MSRIGRELVKTNAGNRSNENKYRIENAPIFDKEILGTQLQK